MNCVTVLFRTAVVVLGAAAVMLAAGCGGSGTPEGDIDVVVADVAGDAIDDAADTVDTTVNPGEVFQPIQDRSFVQEINHTGIEIDSRIKDIVDIVLKPSTAGAALTPFDDVVLLDSEGFWYRGASPLDPNPAAEPIKIVANHVFGDVIGGAFSDDALFIIQKQAISIVSGETPETWEINANIISEQGPLSVSTGNGWTLVSDGAELRAITPSGLHRIGIFTTSGFPIVAAAVSEDHTRLYIAGQNEDGDAEVELWTLDGDGKATDNTWSITLEEMNVRALIVDVQIPDDRDIVVVCDEGIIAPTYMDEPVDPHPVFDVGRIPLGGANDVAKTADGGFIIATNGGAIRMMDRGDGPEWRFYNTLRWVADNDVRAVATDANQHNAPIYFGSAEGMTWVTVEEMNLEDKMALLREKIELRHDRDGAVADSRLMVPGDLSTNIPWDSDNDGGWTCYWVIAECMRWKVTNDPQAKANFDKSLQAMLNLRLLTGEDWFLARSLIRKDGCMLDDCDNPNDGEWYTSPDGEWWVKSDTSNDEVTSHMFMMGPAYDLCADETQKKAIAAHVSNIVGGIIDHGYQLWKPTGECTTYGQFDPGYMLFAVPFGDGGRRAAQMVAGLNLAIYMTKDQESKLGQGETLDMPGSQKFLDAKAFLFNDENNYDDYIMTSTEPPGRMGSGDGDELSMQAFAVLVNYESDPTLKAMWKQEWADVYTNLKTQQDALWDTMQGVIGGGVPDMHPGERWFRLYPLDLIRWPMHNNHRLDLIKAPAYYINKPEFAERYLRSDGRIVPSDERPNDRHNTSQFVIEGGWGANSEMDAADVLAAYWMSRFYGFIEPSE